MIPHAPSPPPLPQFSTSPPCSKKQTFLPAPTTPLDLPHIKDHPPSLDPLRVLGVDLFQTRILPLLDAPSLARSAAVSRHWNLRAVCDTLWEPLCLNLWARRAHLPLQILRATSPISSYRAFSITMEDARKVELSQAEMCARIWQLQVKPSCGPYWYSLDPSSRGEAPLLRRFHCDHSVTALHQDDPIWGGQESVWEFVTFNRSKCKPFSQHVQINRWPHHHVLHLPDGRWRLDNTYASYTTCPDQDANKPLFLKGKVVELCTSCHPEPTKVRQDQ